MARIDIIVSAVDKASKTFNKVGNAVTDFGKKHEATFKKMALGGGAAFATVAAGAKLATDAYKEQEKNEMILENALVKITGATQDQVQAMKDLAAAQQQVGVIGDEVTMVWQAQLATFGTSIDTISSLTSTMQDYAVATYGANVTAEQMNSTANTFGKLMNGLDLGQLKQQGIIMSDLQTEILETGTETEKVAAIQEIMAANLKVTNEMMRETGEGASVALNNSLGDLAEWLGKGLVPIITDLSERLVPLVDKLTAWISANPELTKNIFLVVWAVTWLITVVGTLGLALPAIGAGFAALTWPIGLAILAVGAIAAAGIQMYRHRDTIKIRMGEIWENIKDFSKVALDKIVEYGTIFGRVFLGVMTGWLSEVVIAVVSNRDSIKATISGALDVIAWFITPKLAIIQGFMQAWLDLIKGVVSSVLDGINSVWTTWLELFSGTADRIVTGIGNMFTNIFNGIKSTATSVVDWVLDKINSLIERVNSVSSVVGIEIPTIWGGTERRGVGGAVVWGQPYLVGENWPEIVVPNGSGTVVKTDGTRGGANIVIQTVNINNGTDMDSFRAMLQEIVDGGASNLSFWYAA